MRLPVVPGVAGVRCLDLTRRDWRQVVGFAKVVPRKKLTGQRAPKRHERTSIIAGLSARTCLSRSISSVSVSASISLRRERGSRTHDGVIAGPRARAPVPVVPDGQLQLPEVMAHQGLIGAMYGLFCKAH